MAKRTAAAPPPVATEKQAKKQKTELPAAVAEGHGSKKKLSPPLNTNSNKPKKGGGAQVATKGKSQANNKPKQSTKQAPQGKKPQQKQPPSSNNNGAAKKQPPKSKSRKPTLKPVSLATVLTGPPGKGTKESPSLGDQPQVLQASDFPSLSSTNQPVKSAWSAGSVAILKRPAEGSVPPPPPKVPPKSKTAEKPPVKNKQAGSKQQSKKTEDTAKRNVGMAADSPPKSSLAASLLGARAERVLDESEGAHDLLRLMSQGKMVVQNKGRQRVRPRKKKFSSLKKKVLEERLRQWKDQNKNDTNRELERPLAPMPCTLCLYGFAEADLVQDDEEYEELCTNLTDLAEKISKHCRIAIPRHILDRTSTTYPCFVEFENGQLVEAAISCWNGLSLGGETLRAEPIPVPTGITDNSEWEAQCLEIDGPAKDGQIPNQESESLSRVILMDILTEDDLEDEDCLEETLGDIKTVGSEFGEIFDVFVDKETRSVSLAYNGGLAVAQNALHGLGQKVIGGALIKAVLAEPNVLAESPKQARVILDGILTEDDLDDEDCLEETLGDISRVAEEFGVVESITAEKDQSRVILTYHGGLKVAQTAVAELGKKVIGGIPVCAKLEENERVYHNNISCSIILKGALTEDDLEDEECLDESLGDLRELAAKYGPVLSIQAEGNNVKIEFEGLRDVAVNAVSGFNGMIIGGQTVEATIDADRMDVDSPLVTAISDKPATAEKEFEPLFSGDKRIPDRFAECKRAPKLPVTPGPRKYATLLNDDAVKPLIIEMLGELMRLQKRAIDDKNAKARRRLVMGFREVARGVRARKVKLVVMANNLDDQYGAIDEKLQEILDLCHSEGIPVLFELNKKGIGKALGKTIKVAVVGVQNADGANAEFKKLCKLAQ
eukprot:scaffold34946_cov153-Amphora_coffeaeformis.AAC.2